MIAVLKFAQICASYVFLLLLWTQVLTLMFKLKEWSIPGFKEKIVEYYVTGNILGKFLIIMSVLPYIPLGILNCVIEIISIILNNICGFPKESNHNTKTKSDKSKIK